jgi:hypothetical protein
VASTTGQDFEHLWPAALAATTGQHYWPELLARTPGNISPYTLMMIMLMMMMLIMMIMTMMMMMMVMVMMDRQYIRACACMSVHAPQ